MKEVPFHISQYNQTSGKLDQVNGTMVVIEVSKYPVMPNIEIYKHKNLVPWSNGKKTDYIFSLIDLGTFKRGTKENITEMYKTIAKKIKPKSGIKSVYKAMKKNHENKKEIKDFVKNKFEKTSYIIFDPFKDSPQLQGYGVKDIVILKINNTKANLAKKILGIYQSVKGAGSFTLSNKITERSSLFGGNSGGGSRYSGPNNNGGSGNSGGFGGGGGSGTGESMES